MNDNLTKKVKAFLVITPVLFLHPNVIKKTCEFVFRADIEDKKSQMLNYILSNINRRIDTVLDIVGEDLNSSYSTNGGESNEYS